VESPPPRTSRVEKRVAAPVTANVEDAYRSCAVREELIVEEAWEINPPENVESPPPRISRVELSCTAPVETIVEDAYKESPMVSVEANEEDADAASPPDASMVKRVEEA